MRSISTAGLIQSPSTNAPKTEYLGLARTCRPAKPRTRWPLSVDLSEDDSDTWPWVRDLEHDDGFTGKAN